MKLFTLLTGLLLSVSAVFAQNLTVKYDIALSSDNPNIQAQLGMLSGSTFTVYNKAGKSRTEMNMGGMMTTTTITDFKADKAIMLMDGMTGKLATEMDSIQEKSKDSDAPKVQLVDETKKILDYTCKKAIINLEDGGEFVYWYTEEIQPKSGSMGKYVQKGIPGLPLAYTVKTSQITMNFTATSLQKEVTLTDDKFETKIPAGYTKTSIDKIRQMGM